MKTFTFDCETTGLPPMGADLKQADYKTDYMRYPYIVSLSWKVNDQETKHFVINQEGREIPKEASDIHGITTEIANASPHKIEDVLTLFIEDGKGADLCIGHNIYFDTSNIKAALLKIINNGSSYFTNEFFSNLEEILHKDRRICTMRSTIKFCALPRNKWPKLTELYAKLFPGEVFNAHNSKDDVDATYKSYIELLRLGIISHAAKV